MWEAYHGRHQKPDLSKLALDIANRIASSCSGKDLPRAIAESLLAFPDITPLVKVLATTKHTLACKAFLYPGLKDCTCGASEGVSK